MRLFRKLIRGEVGQALPIVLILLLFGGFLVAPMLAYVSTNLNVGIMVEQKTSGFYAADAGIEDSCWDLLQDVPVHFTDSISPPQTPLYTLSEQVNGMLVTLDLLDKEPDPDYSRATWYTVRSTATLEGAEKGQIVAQIKRTDIYEAFFKNAITSLDYVRLHPGDNITGDIQHGGELKLPPNPESYIWNGTDIPVPPPWPDTEEMKSYYNTEDLLPYDGGNVKINNDCTLGPYVVNDLLSLLVKKNVSVQFQGYSGSEPPPWPPTPPGTPNVALYVAGDLEIHGTGGNCLIDLGERTTIFVEGSIRIWPSCILTGTGQIIAVGDINFQPQMYHPGEIEEDAVLVMSLCGTVNFQPSGDFYGSLAGNVEVNLQPGNTITYEAYGGHWEFPPGDPKVMLVKYSIEK